MDRIKDQFHVPTALEQTWDILLDIERIAPCMPGAQLQEVEGDEYRGIVKIKVGPIQAQYKGTAKLAFVDTDTRTIKIDASGRDTRGQGNASALITVTMQAVEGGTTVDIDTELNVTGKVAQFGRGEMPKISAKLLKQFGENLERDVLREPEPSELERGEPEPSGRERSERGELEPSGRERSERGEPDLIRKIDAPEAEPINVLDVAGGTIAKLLLPLAGVGLVLYLLLRRHKQHKQG